MKQDVDYLFKSSESEVEASFTALMNKIEALGPVTLEPKKTSIHVLNSAAFLGVHPKKKWLDLNIVTNEPIASERVLKKEQVSKNRYHNLVRVNEANEIDSELVSWLKQAYDLQS